METTRSFRRLLLVDMNQSSSVGFGGGGPRCDSGSWGWVQPLSSPHKSAPNPGHVLLYKGSNLRSRSHLRQKAEPANPRESSEPRAPASARARTVERGGEDCGEGWRTVERGGGGEDCGGGGGEDCGEGWRTGEGGGTVRTVERGGGLERGGDCGEGGGEGLWKRWGGGLERGGGLWRGGGGEDCGEGWRTVGEGGTSEHPR
uniref:Uncharacterized protein n=1 Tax=Knipowitschia caucasica TaxID=637954 RepID=A0AAV2JYX7_KNICA